MAAVEASAAVALRAGAPATHARFRRQAVRRPRPRWSALPALALAAAVAAAGAAFGHRPTLPGALALAAALLLLALLFSVLVTRTRADLELAIRENGALLLELEAAREAKEGLHSLAYYDSLTGLPNRSLLYDRLELALSHSRREGRRLALLFLDLDGFKAVNDRFGHAAGDAVLQAVARQWQAQLRDADRLGRVGGEEFVVVCPHTTLEQAHLVAQRLLEATRALRLPDIDPTLHVTTSIGLAQAQPGETRAALFARADAALYRAKQGGRDRIEHAAGPTDAQAAGGLAADGTPQAH